MRNAAFPAAAAGIGLMVAAMIVGPFLSDPAYSSVRHSLSELAGQNMPGAWLGRLGLAGYGAGILCAAALSVRRMPAVAAALIVFGAALIGAAVFPHLHIDPAQGGDLRLDGLHSLFANLTGTAFAVAVLAQLWSAGFPRRDRLGWLALGVSILLPLAMIGLPALAGALQRAMFVIGFLWLLRLFSRV